MEAIKVNLIPNGIPQTCHASQYDVGRQIRLDLFDGFTPYVIQSGDTFTLNVRKPDNHVITETVTGTEGNTYLVIETTEQMTAVTGKNLCEIRVENDGDNIGSLNFIMQVERDVIADGIPSESVIEDLDALVAEAVGDDFYTKSEVDEALSDKANANNVYTKAETDSALSNKAEVSVVDALDTSLRGIEDTELVMPINLLNVNDSDFVLDKKLASTTGEPTNAANSFTSGFVPVEEGKTYNWIYGVDLNVSQYLSRCCGYGTDKTYKSTYTQDNQRGFTVPVGSGIAFIRFSGNKANLSQQNNMFTAGFPDRYYAYHAPYNSYSVKNSALDADFIRNLGGEVERVYPEWELGTFDSSWRLSDSTNTIRSDYIPVADRLEISVPSGYQAKVYPVSLSGERLELYPYICTDKLTVTPEDAKFIRIGFAATTPVTITDPNTYGLDVTIIRYGTDRSFNTEMTANPNVQTVDPSQVLPQYLSLVAVKEKHETGKIDVTVGYLYRTVLAPYKFYYAQGKPENIKYLFDWDTALAGASHNTPIWYCFGITDEGDVICVHRGEIESADRARDYPIVYPHTDYANPVKVMLTGTLPTSWISNSGDYAESGHFYFGEYIRSIHTHAYVWDVTAPYTNDENWTIIKSYERDSDPSDPSSMVPGKIEHIHHVSRDPFSGVLYVTTGDHWTEARIDYYADGAWGVLAEGEEEICRQLNFIYTPTYVYWASDAFAVWNPDTQTMVGGAHKFFRATRDENGLIDLDNLERFEIPYFMSSVATYHTAYIAEPECILVLDRIDNSNAYAELPFHVWNIKEERFELSGMAKQARGSVDQYLGFRCECCQHYPNLYDSKMSVGFSLYPNSIAVCGNPNPNIVPAQGGNTADDSVNANQVNSMTVEVIRND